MQRKTRDSDTKSYFKDRDVIYLYASKLQSCVYEELAGKVDLMDLAQYVDGYGSTKKDAYVRTETERGK